MEWGCSGLTWCLPLGLFTMRETVGSFRWVNSHLAYLCSFLPTPAGPLDHPGPPTGKPATLGLVFPWQAQQRQMKRAEATWDLANCWLFSQMINYTSREGEWPVQSHIATWCQRQHWNSCLLTIPQRSFHETQLFCHTSSPKAC